MRCVGCEAAPIALQGVLGTKTRTFALGGLRKWAVLFFYPKDFTFICPTEALGFNALHGAFAELGAEVFGISTDSVETHREWLIELGGLAYPLLSDADAAVCRAYDVLDEKERVAKRATFIVNPDGIISYAVAYQANVGRSVEETLRVLKALQTKKLCPADWQPGQPTGDDKGPGR